VDIAELILAVKDSLMIADEEVEGVNLVWTYAEQSLRRGLDANPVVTVVRFLNRRIVDILQKVTFVKCVGSSVEKYLKTSEERCSVVVAAAAVDYLTPRCDN
jgi:hypothetical protein